MQTLITVSQVSTDRRGYLSTSEAAKEVGVHPTTLQRYVKRGDIKAAGRTPGGHLRFDLDDLREQMAALLDRTEPSDD